MRKSHSGRKKTPAKKAETIRERCRKLFRLTPIQLTVAWRQVAEREPGTASYVAALARLGRTTKSPEVQASKVLRLAKVQEAMAWMRRELGITAQEAEEEFSVSVEREKARRFLSNIRDGGFSRVLGRGLEIDEAAWLAFPPEVQDLFSEIEVGIRTGDNGKERRVITKFKILDRLKAQKMLAELDGLNPPRQMDPALLELLAKLEGFAAARKARG